MSENWRHTLTFIVAPPLLVKQETDIYGSTIKIKNNVLMYVCTIICTELYCNCNIVLIEIYLIIIRK